MKWTRKAPGHYVAGPYTIDNRDSWWYGNGPGVDGGASSFHLATLKAAIESRVTSRVADPATVPVVGDVVEYAGRRGQISALMATNDGSPLFCIKLARGKRQCLLRSEFTVVIP